MSKNTVETKDEVPTVTDTLFQQRSIAADLFAVYIQPIGEGVQEESAGINFGGVDTTRYTGDIHFAPITGTSPANDYWGIDAAFVYNGQAVMSTTAGMVDLGSFKLLLATDAFNKFTHQTGATKDDATGQWTLTSDQYTALQPLVLQINGAAIEIPPNALIWPRAHNNKIGGSVASIYLIVDDLKTKTGMGLDFIIGYRILTRFYTVFDAGNSRVGIATTAYTNGTPN